MVSYALEDVQTTVQHAVASSPEINPASVINTSIDPFKNLHTEYMQKKLYKENFNLVVSSFFRNNNYYNYNNYY